MPTWDELAQRQESQKIYLAELELARPDGLGGIETKTLRLSTQGLDPMLTSVYYEPRLQGVPDFSRRMQEVFFGSTQVAFGNLVVLIGDGGLDQDLQDWNWAGRQAVIKLGFDGLPVADYRTIFTGRMGQPQWTDQRLTIPIKDFQADCLRKKLAAGTYNDTLPIVVQTCLDAAGITSKDQTLWDAWAADNPFTIWLKTDGNESISTILDKLLSGLACWWGFDRAGNFQIGTFTAPSATDSPDLGFSDIEILSFKSKQLDKLYWKIGVEYYSDLTTDPPTISTVTQQDSTIESLNPLALEGGAKPTCLTALTDAQTILDRWWNLLSVQRHQVTITAKVQPLSLTLNSIVHISRPRFGIDQNFIVIGLRENYTKNQAQLELFA